MFSGLLSPAATIDCADAQSTCTCWTSWTVLLAQLAKCCVLVVQAIWDMFDTVVVLSEGRCLFSGAAVEVMPPQL